MRLINVIKNNMALRQVYKRSRQHLALEQSLLHQDLWHLWDTHLHTPCAFFTLYVQTGFRINRRLIGHCSGIRNTDRIP